MATRPKKPAKGKRPPSPGRRARSARSHAIKRLPDAVTDALDGERPFSGWRGITRAEVTAESADRVVLTRDAVANAVRALVSLAARWEVDNGFNSAAPELRAHKLKALEDVVSILQVEQQSAPIARADKYRVTRDDANLLTVFDAVEAALTEYSKNSDTGAVLPRLAWLLGNTYRIPFEDVETALTTFAAEAARDAGGTSAKGRKLSANWVRNAFGPSLAAKKLLGELLPAGNAGSRIAALKRLVARANAQRQGRRQGIREIFDALENEAQGAPVSEAQRRSYVARVIG